MAAVSHAEPFETSARVFADPEWAEQWAERFVSLTPGRELDAALYRLSQETLNAEELRIFIMAVSDRLSRLDLDCQLHPDVLIESFRQLCRGVDRLRELEFDPCDQGVVAPIDCALWSVTAALGRSHASPQLLALADIVAATQHPDRFLERIPNRGL